MPLSKEKKVAFLDRMQVVFATYTKFFVVGVENVGSKAINQTRMDMRGTSEIVMGKKTLLRKALNIFLEANPGHLMENLEQFLVGSCGFVFTNGDLGKVKGLIEANRVPAPARPGVVAPISVTIPPGPTGCDPGQTSFFQVLQVPTKIVKGQIEITSPVDLVKQGEKVGPSEAALLDKLHIMPFEFGFQLRKVFDNGSLFSAEVLDIDDEQLEAKFAAALRDIAAVSLAVGFPTQASVAHSMGGAFKDLCAIVVGLDNYSFAEAEPFKQYLLDPSAFACAGGGGGGGGDAPAAAAAEPAKVEEEVDAMEGGLDMFGGGADY